MAIFVTWGEPRVPQIATPSRMAAGTEDVSADAVLTEIKTRVGSGNFRVDAQAKDWAGRVVADVLGLNVSNEAHKSKIKRSTLGPHKGFSTRREDKEFLDVVEVPNPESGGAGKVWH